MRRMLGLALLLAACGGPEWGEESVGESQDALLKACPPATKVHGIDIASYQHPNGAAIDWAKVAASKHFVIIKATEGTGYTNKYYAGDAKGARAAGLVVGAYHYLRYTSTGTAQADHFLTQLGGSVPVGDLPAMLDVEDTGDAATAAQRVTVMKDWLARVESKTGRKPMIYSGGWYWNGSYLNSPTGFDAHPLAWAAYPSDPAAVDNGTYCPSIPNDFGKLTIWQFSGSGKVSGISGDVDLDVFYGSLAELKQLAGAAPAYAGTSLGLGGQSYPIVAAGPVTVTVGQTVTGWVDLKNTGTATWQPGVVKLAPIPRDVASPYQAASWSTGSRISTVTAPVPPGSVGRFQLDLKGSVVGEQILSLGFVAEGITWFANAPQGGGPADGYFAVKVKVVPAPVGTGGATGVGGASGAGGSTGMGGSTGVGGSTGIGGSTWTGGAGGTVSGSDGGTAGDSTAEAGSAGMAVAGAAGTSGGADSTGEGVTPESSGGQRPSGGRTGATQPPTEPPTATDEGGCRLGTSGPREPLRDALLVVLVMLAARAARPARARATRARPPADPS